ncbi:MAG: YdcF family protein [Acidobacteria bacterium]|nr:YdcF family protein [Acidobacteriota bacterium]
MVSRARSLFRLLAWILAAAVVIILAVLLWGDDWLIASAPSPSHVDAAVVLQGSIVGYQARIAGAMALAGRGVADRVLLSLPRESYWGESIPPAARAYLERNYGRDLAARVDFCEMGPGVDSTAEESEAAESCIAAHHWRSIAIVTSNYHTRRAGILWRRVLRRRDPALELSIEGVADPEFQKPWWRHRQAAKIWLGESEKLVWTLLGG